MRWIALLIIFTTGEVLAHGGGLNTCGGHNNRKTGNYHVHRMNLHCACHPEQQQCKGSEDDKAAKYIKYLQDHGYEVKKK
ncbi:MAG: YHYH domain-containing protein [Gammaproteobacteria bacterium]|nr:MAG: YHYH domain-containing protein [Gammaproteobacteria bacterium]